MKQKNPLIYFGFGFLMAAGMMFLLAARSIVSAENSNDPPPGTSPTNDAFVYEGVLNDSKGEPVNGYYDFTFSLFDAESGGTEYDFDTANNVNVINGRYTVELDFTSNIYADFATWIEIEVSPAGGNEFITIKSRQEVRPVPMALSLPNVYSDNSNHEVMIDADTTINGSLDILDGLNVNNSLDVNNSDISVNNGDINVNNGDIIQGFSDNGVVKAAALIRCGTYPHITRSFNNNNISTMHMLAYDDFNPKSCTINFGFDLSQRYWHVSTAGNPNNFNNNPNPEPNNNNIVGCDVDPFNTSHLVCKGSTLDSNYGFFIIIMIY